MKSISGNGVRRVFAVLTVVVLASVSACGSGGDEGGGSASSSSPPAEASASGKPGAAADGSCGDGAFETQVVKAAQGVQLTVPADWKVESARAGAAVGLYPPASGDEEGDGYLAVQTKDQTLDEAVDEVLKSTADSAETTSEDDLDLAGFDAARMVTFAYDDSDGTSSVDVVAVAGGLRVVANMTWEGELAEQAVVESCLSTLTRTQ